MQYLVALAAVAAFAAPVFASPIGSEGTSVTHPLEIRAPLVSCRPKLEGKTTTKTFSVDLARSEAVARTVGLTTGKSGDPHRYFNSDKLVFGKNNCDKTGAILFEYPVYQEGVKGDWEKDVKTDKQKNGPTPLRAVYANSNGGIVFCGVMTHTTVTTTGQGKGFFQLCT